MNDSTFLEVIIQNQKITGPASWDYAGITSFKKIRVLETCTTPSWDYTGITSFKKLEEHWKPERVSSTL